jgi:transcriptional regulator with XRE-family HTH domain
MGGMLIREARRRAGVSQTELARRIGTTQSAIARLERGKTEPSLKRIQEILRALGLDLRVGIVPLDDSNWLDAKANLNLDVDARVRQNQRILRAAREARRQAVDVRS